MIGSLKTEADLERFIKDRLGPLDAKVRQLQGKVARATDFGWTLLEAVDAAAGRVVLGTDAAGARRPPQGPETNLKVIRGTVAADGSITAGSGFSVTNDATGKDTITFTAPFNDIPTVIPAVAGNAAGIARVTPASATTTAVQINTTDHTSSAFQNHPYHFVAIGPA